MTKDMSIMARKLAIWFVGRDVEQGRSEHEIQQSWHGGGRSHEHWHDAEDGFGGYQISIGGYYDYTEEIPRIARKKVPNTKVLVEEVYGVEGIWIFSLHEIYEECKKGQLSLL